MPPKSNTARPGVVLVHGGGFSHGDKEEMEDVAIEMATRGFVTVSINYRLTGLFWPFETEKAILDAIEVTVMLFNFKLEIVLAEVVLIH